MSCLECNCKISGFFRALYKLGGEQTPSFLLYYLSLHCISLGVIHFKLSPMPLLNRKKKKKTLTWVARDLSKSLCDGHSITGGESDALQNIQRFRFIMCLSALLLLSGDSKIMHHNSQPHIPTCLFKRVSNHSSHRIKELLSPLFII